MCYAIKRKDTLMRDSIRPDERIAVTLGCLATGETFKWLEFSFRISYTCISSICIFLQETNHDQLSGSIHLRNIKNNCSGIFNLHKPIINFLRVTINTTKLNRVFLALAHFHLKSHLEYCQMHQLLAFLL